MYLQSAYEVSTLQYKSPLEPVVSSMEQEERAISCDENPNSVKAHTPVTSESVHEQSEVNNLSIDSEQNKACHVHGKSEIGELSLTEIAAAYVKKYQADELNSKLSDGAIWPMNGHPKINLNHDGQMTMSKDINNFDFYDPMMSNFNSSKNYSDAALAVPPARVIDSKGNISHESSVNNNDETNTTE